MVHLEEREAPPPATRSPCVSLRLASTLALLAGLLILAHGCHGPDEDHELFAPRLWSYAVLHRDAPGLARFGARAALPDEGDATASRERALSERALNELAARIRSTSPSLRWSAATATAPRKRYLPRKDAKTQKREFSGITFASFVFFRGNVPRGVPRRLRRRPGGLRRFEALMHIAAQITLVALGSALGGVTRWAVGLGFQRWLGTAFPWGTFFINITGSFFLGWLATVLTQRYARGAETWLSADHLRLLVGVGFTGAYTTFSTFEYEANHLIHGGESIKSMAYLVGSVVMGLLAVRLGIMLARVSA